MNTYKDAGLEKEHWDSSSEKAKELKISDFGTQEEVIEKARMERFPQNYTEARKILSSFIVNPLKNISGLTATLSKNSIEKILSDAGEGSAKNLKAHLLAAGNLDKLFTHSIEPWSFEMNPNKNNDNIADIHRLYALMEYEGKITVVKITVKEMKNSKDGNRIYTIRSLRVGLG